MSLMHNPPHPGQVLRERLAGHTTTEAADKLGVARVTLSRILNGAAGISAAMDLRLARALGTSPGFWLRMQAERDLWAASKTSKGRVRKISEPGSASRIAEPAPRAYARKTSASKRDKPAGKGATGKLSLEQLWQRARKLGAAMPGESADIIRRDRNARHGR